MTIFDFMSDHPVLTFFLAYMLFEASSNIAIAVLERKLKITQDEECRLRNILVRSHIDTDDGWFKRLDDENQRLRTALEFYAYKHGYQPYYDSIHGDEGEIAREALKEQPL